MICNFLLFFIFLSAQIFVKAQSPSKNSISTPKAVSKAKGLLLSLHLSANDEKRQLLIQKLKKEGLTKDTEIERFNLQIYKWKKEQTFLRAFRLCKELLESSAFVAVVQHCEPDSVFVPTNSRLSFTPYQEVPRSWMQDKNIRTCEIVKDDLNLWWTSLSDNWAQEMIGADLSKKRLKKIGFQIPKDKVLVEVFDFFTDDPKAHGYPVTNLISSKFPGEHSVLPNIEKHKVNTNIYLWSDFLKRSDELLKKVDKKCGSKPTS